MKIPVVRVDRVGDTVMMTPALSEIIQYYPNAGTTLLTSPVGKHLLNNFHPNITDIWSWQRSGIFKPYTDKSKIRKLLRKIRFDKIICFGTSPRIAGVFSEATGDFYWNWNQNQTQTTTEIKHYAKPYLDFDTKACNKSALRLYNTLPVDIESSKQDENELANIVINKYDISYGEEVIASKGGIIKSLKSQSTFERYKAMLKRAELLITPDSGPMHVASALGTKIIAFFSMKDPGDCGPYMPAENFTILRTEDTATPDKGVAAIDVDTVFNACKTILSNQEKV